MSRAFIKEDQTPIDLPDRPVSKHRNLVTPEGLVAIDAALSRFKAAHQAAHDKEDMHAAAAALRELRYWGARRASAEVVRPATNTQTVSFGLKVTLRREDGREQTFRIVGEDEADPSHGTVSYVSPLARAVLGGKPGDTVKIGRSKAIILAVRM
jgi:transcription elongation GreA/GreB family factor